VESENSVNARELRPLSKEGRNYGVFWLVKFATEDPQRKVRLFPEPEGAWVIIIGRFPGTEERLEKLNYWGIKAIGNWISKQEKILH